MFRALFGQDGLLNSLFNHISDALLLSLLWLLFCLPVVTIGPSTAAMYAVAVKVFRRGEKGTCRKFWQAFKSNLRRGLPLSLIWLTFFASVAYCMIFLWNAIEKELVGASAFFIACVFVFLLIGIQGILFPMVSRFENTVGKLLVNTVVMAMGNLPRTLMVGLLVVLGIALCLWQGWLVILVPGVVTVACTYFIEPVFAPYMSEE